MEKIRKYFSESVLKKIRENLENLEKQKKIRKYFFNTKYGLKKLEKHFQIVKPP